MEKQSKMNKKELVRILAKETGLTIVDIEEVVLPALDKVIDILVEEDRKLVINGVCKAEVHRKKGRKGVSPNGAEYDNTGEVKTSVVVTFPR